MLQPDKLTPLLRIPTRIDAIVDKSVDDDRTAVRHPMLHRASPRQIKVVRHRIPARLAVAIASAGALTQRRQHRGVA